MPPSVQRRGGSGRRELTGAEKISQALGVAQGILGLGTQLTELSGITDFTGKKAEAKSKAALNQAQLGLLEDKRGGVVSQAQAPQAVQITPNARPPEPLAVPDPSLIQEPEGLLGTGITQGDLAAPTEPEVRKPDALGLNDKLGIDLSSPLLQVKTRKIRMPDGTIKEERVVTQESFEKFNKTTEATRKELAKANKSYSRINQVIASGVAWREKGVANMNGSDDFQLIKAAVQFNDTPRVTEGEINAMQSAQSFFDQLILKGNRLVKNGDKLSIRLRTDILNTIATMGAVSVDAQAKTLSPVLKEIRALKLPEDRILDPSIVKIIENGSDLFKVDVDAMSDEEVEKQLKELGVDS